MRITKLHLLLILSAIIAGGGYLYYRVRLQEKNVLQEIYQKPAGGEAVVANQAEEPTVVEEQVKTAEEQAKAEEAGLEEEQRVKAQTELERVKGLIEKGKSENFDIVSAEEMFNLGVKSFENKNYPPALQCFLEAAERLKKAVPIAPKEAAAEKSVTSYKVKRGDSLWSIAKRKSIYGRGAKWIKIWKANENQIKDFDRIYAGQILLIPDNRGKKHGKN